MREEFEFYGSVSKGKTKAEMLADFVSVLEELTDGEYGEALLIQDANNIIDELDGLKKPDEGGSPEEDIPNVLELVVDTLNKYAPEGYYFGAKPDDDQDYGFWEEEEDETDKKIEKNRG